MGAEELAVRCTGGAHARKHAHARLSTWLLLLVFAGVLVAFWFIAHGVALQYFVLFLGVMSWCVVAAQLGGAC